MNGMKAKLKLCLLTEDMRAGKGRQESLAGVNKSNQQWTILTVTIPTTIANAINIWNSLRPEGITSNDWWLYQMRGNFGNSARIGMVSIRPISLAEH